MVLIFFLKIRLYLPHEKEEIHHLRDRFAVCHNRRVGVMIPTSTLVLRAVLAQPPFRGVAQALLQAFQKPPAGGIFSVEGDRR